MGAYWPLAITRNFLLGALLLFFVAPARSDDVCLDPEPLLQVQWDAIDLDQDTVLIGEWRLPASVFRRDLLSQARIKLQLVQGRESGAWRGQLDFSFPDPKPYGIPYSFQRAELSWESGSDRNASVLDWSHQCSGPGRSMYPGQAWSGSMELWGTQGIRRFHRPVLRVWGTRN